MRKSILVFALVLAAMLVMAIPAFAITGNYVEDFEHPFVGMVAFYNAEGEFVWRCSGSLISPTKFLTAGHCTDATDPDPANQAITARVWFQQDAGANYDPATQYDSVTGYPDDCAKGTRGKLCATSKALYNYGFDDFAGFPNIHDVGLVILKQSIDLPEYGQLPEAGVLDKIATARGGQDTIFTSSGYGLSRSNQPQSGIPNTSFRIRLMAESTLVNTTSANTDGYNLELQGNGDDRGGTCSGDSGGPVFLGPYESNTIVAVTSFGMNAICRGTDYSYRIDRTDVLNWINSY